jgi:hypothetical protein
MATWKETEAEIAAAWKAKKMDDRSETPDAYTAFSIGYVCGFNTAEDKHVEAIIKRGGIIWTKRKNKQSKR